MVFQFEHVDLDHKSSKWEQRPLPLPELKQSLARWQEVMGDRGWNSLYWSNHDQPRVVSRFGNDKTYWRESATALATVLHLHRGTPYVYQGEELGMTNVPFDRVEDFRDIESLNYYHDAVERLGLPVGQVLAQLRHASRDNARTPMQWTGGEHAGFTIGDPWLAVNDNHVWINAESQRDDPGSVYAHYRSLVALRHKEPVLVDGDFALVEPEHPRLWAFRRRLGDDCLAVYANFSDEPLDVELPEAEVVLTNLQGGTGALQPWEARVLRLVDPVGPAD
jgi:oligo-1,6-glucosidase